jgi:hypothetical protein
VLGSRTWAWLGLLSGAGVLFASRLKAKQLVSEVQVVNARERIIYGHTMLGRKVWLGRFSSTDLYPIANDGKTARYRSLMTGQTFFFDDVPAVRELFSGRLGGVDKAAVATRDLRPTNVGGTTLQQTLDFEKALLARHAPTTTTTTPAIRGGQK